MKRVVITGIGAVSPNGIGREAFADAVIAGKSGIAPVSGFDASRLDSRVAGQIPWNGEYFSKKEQRNIPRVAQFALQAAGEALEDAGILSSSLLDHERNAFGVLLGSGGGSVEFMEKHYGMFYGRKDVSPSVYVISASTPGGLSSEISIRFGLRGRSHVITTGCTSSSDAIGYAFHEIQAGRLKRALTGGADAPIAEGIMHGFCLMKVLSTGFNEHPEKASRPFAADRDGFVLGEGSWMFVLEERDLAVSRGAKIYAEIVGYGSSCEAFHAVRLRENGAGNFQAMRIAVDEAEIPSDAIGYVNLHGTSTQLNDKVETQAMKDFFGERAYKIPMSSTKSMIGHPQGASGAAGIAATILSMKRKKIHPTINIDRPDPECDLDYVADGARDADLEYALCNTLGFGSKCSALVFKNRNGS